LSQHFAINTDDGFGLHVIYCTSLCDKHQLRITTDSQRVQTIQRITSMRFADQSTVTILTVLELRFTVVFKTI